MIYLKTMVTSLSMVFALNLHAEPGQIPTVESVDLPAYLGLWHEVRRIENDFQDRESKKSPGVCFNTTAEYSLLPNDKIQVKNTCFRNTGVGEVAVAKARVLAGDDDVVHVRPHGDERHGNVVAETLIQGRVGQHLAAVFAEGEA